MMAVKEGNQQNVTELLALDADVNLADNKGYTALMLAAMGRHNAVARMLIRHGVFRD